MLFIVQLITNSANMVYNTGEYDTTLTGPCSIKHMVGKDQEYEECYSVSLKDLTAPSLTCLDLESHIQSNASGLDYDLDDTYFKNPFEHLENAQGYRVFRENQPWNSGRNQA